MAHRRDRARPALLVLLLVALGATVVAAAPGPDDDREVQPQVSCAGRVADGKVTSVIAPSFPTPPPAPTGGRRGPLVDLAVDGTLGARVWVTDGWSIARSDDEGCSWEVVHSLDQTGAFEGQSGAIVALATAEAGGATDLLYILVQDLSVPSTSARFQVLVTDDGGSSFSTRGQGLGPVNLGAADDRCGNGQACDIMGTSEPNTVFVRFASTDRTLIYRSTDQGRSFEGRNAVTEFGSVSPANGVPSPPPVLTDLADDPFDGNRLWGAGADALHQSQDGGRSFTRYEPFEHFILPLHDFSHVEVVRVGEHPFPVIGAIGVDASGRQRVAFSPSNGDIFFPAGGEGNDAITGRATAMALGSNLTMAVATDRGIEVRPAVGGSGRAIRQAGAQYADVHRLRVVSPANDFDGGVLRLRETFWGVSPDRIVTFDVIRPEFPGFDPEQFTFDGDVLDAIFNPLTLPSVMPGDLTGPTRVDLAIGEQADLRYLLEVPPVPTPVDIFFLLDETGSMQDEFDALTLGFQRIADDLADRGLDVNVGLGTYGNGFRYKRYREIGPVDREFADKLASIRAGGDGEVAYTALHQVITGTGLKRSRAGNGTRSGQDAQWRENTIRMIVHATDEELSEEPEGPFKAETLALLAGSGAKHLGLIAFDSAGTADQLRNERRLADWEPMFDLARVTGALAPGPDGIDCDRDGIEDIEPGEPIACYLSPATTNQAVSAADAADLLPDLAEVIVAMLDAETLFGTVGFNHSDSPLVPAFAPLDRTSRANFREPVTKQAQAFAVCTEALAGRQETVTLTATSSTRVLAGARVRVTCKAREAAPAGGVIPPPVGAAVAAAPASPPAPIQAPSVSQGAVQSSSFASSNSLVTQAGAAAAQQEQQQYQQAGIGKDTHSEQQPGIAYEFSARRDRPDPAGITLAVGAMFAVGAGLARSAQRRDRSQAVRVRW